MSSFPNFEEEKKSGKEDMESGLRSKNAISDSEKNVDDVLDMKDTTGDAEGKHDEGSEDGKKKVAVAKCLVFFCAKYPFYLCQR